MKKTFVIHPLLMAVFPVLSLFDHNKDMLNIGSLFLPVTITFVLVIVFFSALQFFLKNIYKTSAITSLFFVLFFLFGHVNSLFPPYLEVGGHYFKDVHYYLLLVVWLFFFFMISKEIFLNKKSFVFATSVLNKISFFLVIFPLISIAVYAYGHQVIKADSDFVESEVSVERDVKKNYPDIYYIIFDAYARGDVLQKYFKLDNEKLYQALREKDFFVAEKSTSNYSQTYLSLSSSLNMKYINDLAEQVGKNSADRGYLRDLIKDNKIYDILKNKGYEFVVMPPMWSGVAGNLKSDIEFSDKNRIDNFENMFISLTPFGKILHKKIVVDYLRDRIRYNFEHISDIAKIDKPTFTYVHFLAPHPPFLFDKSGNDVYPPGSATGLDGEKCFKENPDRQEYIEKYREMILFMNGKIEKLASDILEKSSTPPIVIFQADHGSGFTLDAENPDKTDMRERMSIFNAFYVPENIKKDLYKEVSPVNSFRIIFSHLFDKKYEILPDRSYFSKWSEPYNFIDVTRLVL